MDTGYRSPLVDLVLRGEAARDVRLLAARGLLPRPAHEQIALLAVLSDDQDAEIAAQAKTTLGRLPREALDAFLSTDVPAELRAFFAAHTAESVSAGLESSAMADDEGAAERATVDKGAAERATVDKGAAERATVDKGAAERATVDKGAAERATVDKGAAERATVDKGAAEAVTVDEGAAEAVTAGDESAAEAATPEDEGPGDPQLVSTLPIAQRLKLASKGTREQRAQLIRDSNRIVATAVLTSPKLTESEVEAFAKMGNVSEDVLRIIGTNRAWLKNYGIVHAVTRNPKTPPAISMQLMHRLTEKDIKMLTTDRNVPEALRLAARRTLTKSKHG